MSRHALILLAGCAAGALTAAPQAHAQAAPGGERSVAVEEVIVTADRRERRLQDVPTAISTSTVAQAREGAGQVSAPAPTDTPMVF